MKRCCVLSVSDQLMKVVLPSFLYCKVTYFHRAVPETVNSPFLIQLRCSCVFNVLPIAIIM